MPNIAISSLPLATLPLDGPNSFFEVQTIEGGETVSRKVASDDLALLASIIVEDEGVPLAGGATTLDFVGAGVAASGVGSTKTITIPGGVTTLAALSDVDLTGQATGDLLFNVDGVNWEDTGGDLLINIGLNQLQSNYQIVASAGLLLRALNGDVSLESSNLGGGAYQYVVQVGGNDLIRIQDDGTAFFGGTGGADSQLRSGAEVSLLRGGLDTIALSLAPAAGGLSVNNTLTGAGLERVLTIGDLVVPGGQVDSVVGGTNISVNVADPVNPIVNLDAAITGVSVNGVSLSNAGVATDFLNEEGNYVAAGGAIPDPLIIASINATSSESVSQTISPYANVALNIGPNLTGTMGMMQINRQNIQTRQSSGGFNATLFININGAGTAGSNVIIGGLNGAQVEVDFGVAVRFQHAQVGTTVAETAAAADGGFLANNLNTGAGLERVLTTADLSTSFDPAANQTITGDWTFDNAVFDLKLGVSTAIHFRNPSDNSATFVQNLGPTLQWGIAGADFGSGIFEIAQSSFAKLVCPPIFIGEQAAAEADVLGDGQVWVRNDNPNTLMFTDDTGNDFVVSGFSVAREKATTESTNTDIVLSDDAELTMTLPVGTYRIHLIAILSANTAGGMGIQYRLNFTGSIARTRFIQQNRINGADAQRNPTFFNSTSNYATITTVGASDYLDIEGVAVVTVAGVLSFQWAQQSSNANDLSINNTSSLTAQLIRE